MRVTIRARTWASSLRNGGCSLLGFATLLGFKPEKSFLTPSSLTSKGSICGTFGEASFIACLLRCSRDSGEGYERTALNWSFSMVALFLLSLSSFLLLFSCATTCVSCSLCWWISRIFCCILYGLFFIWRWYVGYFFYQYSSLHTLKHDRSMLCYCSQCDQCCHPPQDHCRSLRQTAWMLWQSMWNHPLHSWQFTTLSPQLTSLAQHPHG